MEALARTRATLSVPQIPERIRASERAVRQNVGLLLRRGFLDRRSIVTPGRKFAYSYSLRSVEVILAAARRDFRRTVRRLEAFAGHLGSAHA